MKKLVMFAILLSLFLTGSVFAEGKAWVIDDFDKAVETAKKENKNILLMFTGSDWCGWCMKLHSEVFDKEEFVKEATKNYVLASIDFPKNKPQTNEVKIKNRNLARKFGVQGYPTVFLCTSDGTPYFRTGYEKGGPENYLKSMEAVKANVETLNNLFEEIKNAPADKKIAAYGKLLKFGSDNGLTGPFAKYIEEAAEFDEGNAMGYKEQALFTSLQASVSSSNDKDQVAAEVEKAKKEIIKFAKNNPIHDKKMLYVTVGNWAFQTGDKKTATTLFSKAYYLDQNGRLGKAIQGFLSRQNLTLAEEKDLEMTDICKAMEEYNKSQKSEEKQE